jgi:hypothetical protein
MSLSEVYTNLLSFEKCLINREAASNPPSSPLTNYASRGGCGSRSCARTTVALADMLAVTHLATPMDLVTTTMTAAMISPTARSVVLQTTLHPSAGIAMMMDIRRKKNPRRARRSCRPTLWRPLGTPTYARHITSPMIQSAQLSVRSIKVGNRSRLLVAQVCLFVVLVIP